MADNTFSKLYSKTLKSGKTVEMELAIKEDCQTVSELLETINFVAVSSHQFYLKVAEIIKNRIS